MKTIDDLIKELKAIKAKHGNLGVCVAYRDAGGYFSGADMEVEATLGFAQGDRDTIYSLEYNDTEEDAIDRGLQTVVVL